MSNFICDKCGMPILESSIGDFYTECAHYPIEQRNGFLIKRKEVKPMPCDKKHPKGMKKGGKKGK